MKPTVTSRALGKSKKPALTGRAKAMTVASPKAQGLRSKTVGRARTAPSKSVSKRVREMGGAAYGKMKKTFGR